MKLNPVIWVVSNFTHRWFSLSNSEKVKALTLVLCRIRKSFIKDIRGKFGVPNLPKSPEIRQNSNGGISDFQISGQSLINKNCHNSRFFIIVVSTNIIFQKVAFQVLNLSDKCYLNVLM